jgi:hypothetical protein
MPASIRFLSALAALAFCVPASASETAPAAVQPAPVVTAAPAEATAVPAAPTTTRAAKPVDAAQAKSGDGQAAAVTRVPSGYKSKVVGGETLLCRKSTPLGSRFPTEVCMTTAQYEESVRQQDGLRQELTGKQKSYSINQ